MATEAFPSRVAHQPESNGHASFDVHGVDLHQLVIYSEGNEYRGGHAAGVALELFGNNFSRPGMFVSEAARDLDVPYMVVREGDGHITSYNLVHGGKAAAGGLNGFVITEAEAEDLRPQRWTPDSRHPLTGLP